MKIALREGIAEFFDEIEKDIKATSIRKASRTFLERHPEYAEYSPNTVREYIIDHKANPKLYEATENRTPDLSGDFNFTKIDIPSSWAISKPQYPLNGFKNLGIISDLHIPYHDHNAIAAALTELKKRDIDALLINGDLMDFKSICHHLSRERIGFATIAEELVVGRKFLTELRKFFPSIPIFLKEGNHEVWLTLAINKRPQLASLDGQNLESQLKLKDYDINFIPEWQVIRYGKLSIIHGHEVRLTGVTPARSLWLKTYDNCLAGHVHRQHSYSVKSIDRDVYGCWTTGCLADLYPAYAGANPQAEHGCARVQMLDDDGMFHVELIRIYNGRVI